MHRNARSRQGRWAERIAVSAAACAPLSPTSSRPPEGAGCVLERPKPRLVGMSTRYSIMSGRSATASPDRSNGDGSECAATGLCVVRAGELHPRHQRAAIGPRRPPCNGGRDGKTDPRSEWPKPKAPAEPVACRRMPTTLSPCDSKIAPAHRSRGTTSATEWVEFWMPGD